MSKHNAAQKKRLQTLAVKTREQKEKFLEQLRKYPIVQAAADKTGVGRSTYYDWYHQDQKFAKAADEAIRQSVRFVNDMAESQLIRSIQDKNMTAIIFWLKSRHPAYVDRRRYQHEHEIVPRTFTEEQQIAIVRAMKNIGLENIIKANKHIMRKATEEQAEHDRGWGGKKTPNDKDEEPEEGSEGA